MKCRIIISEPWDFKSVDGNNILDGDIIRKYDSGDYLFKSTSEVEINSFKGQYFYLSRRFKNDIKELFDKENPITVNGGILTDELCLWDDAQSVETKARFAFIGHFERPTQSIG